MYSVGKITKEEYCSLENTACPGCGSCAFLGTANTMGCLSEALGMSLPGSALIPAVYGERLRSSFMAGRAVVDMVNKGITGKTDNYKRKHKKRHKGYDGNLRFDKCGSSFKRNSK